jgi:hypothetical protein
VGRRIAALLVVLVASGCGRAHQFAGMPMDEARRDSVDVARTMPNVAQLGNEFVADANAKPVGTFRDRNSGGGEAWLTVFRLFRGQEGDPDQACVWAWRDEGGPHYEDAPSVAWGQAPEPLHDRCTAFVFARGLAAPDQTAGNEEAPPVLARPEPMTPFGVLAPTSVVDVLPAGAYFLSGPSIAAPVLPPAGTCGYAGYVTGPDGYEHVPFATLAVTPSNERSGISDGGALGWPRSGVTLTADRRGAFVVTNLPYVEAGYDISLRGLGYAPTKIVHEDCYEGAVAVGEWQLGLRPTLVDATPARSARR